MIQGGGGGQKAFVYEVTAYVERGWWLVHAVDIGRQSLVSTLGEVEETARRMYATHFSCRADEISIEVTVYRTRPDAVIRTVWRRLARQMSF